MSVLSILGTVLISGGLVFMLVGAIGVIRMPDVFTRQHAAGMTDTGGAILILLGLMCFGTFPVIVRLGMILVFLVFTSPIATHAVCRAAIHNGVEPLLGEAARGSNAGGGR